MTVRNPHIDPYSYEPKYHQMFTILRTKIENGDSNQNPYSSRKRVRKAL